jgi:hypothetical protein
MYLQTAIKVTKFKNVSNLNIKHTHTKRRQPDGWVARKVDKKRLSQMAWGYSPKTQ